MKSGTATIVNSCFNGKMGFKDYLKAVFGLFKDNIKDLVIISLFVQIGITILGIVNFPLILESLLEIIVRVVSTVAIIKLVDNRARGNMINAFSAIKLFKECWIPATGAILLQSLLGGIPFIGIIMNVILAVSIPMGTLQNKSMIQSATDSFKLVKGQAIDVLAKILLITFITRIGIFAISLIVMQFPSIFIVGQLLVFVLTVLQVISTLVLFYNLPSVSE